MMKLVNIGCGNNYIVSEEWTNVDFNPNSASVIKCDITKGLPFNDNFFDVVYHSHVLEHLSKEEGVSFIKECFRVLKPAGIMRVVVPDLEQIVNTYLNQLNLALQCNKEAINNYEWTVIELIDQMTRRESGGLMLKYLTKKNLNNFDFIYKRIGYEAIKMREIIHSYQVLPKHKFNPKTLINKINNKLHKILLGNKYKYYKTAKFIKTGEVHQWMYDRFSMGILLKECGFTDIEKHSSISSKIPEWHNYYLDHNENGILKPDSLFIEARK